MIVSFSVFMRSATGTTSPRVQQLWVEQPQCKGRGGEREDLELAEYLLVGSVLLLMFLGVVAAWF